MNGRGGGYIRLLPGGQNGGITNAKGSKWSGICKYPPEKKVQIQGGPIQDYGNYYLLTMYTSTFLTLGVMDFQYTNMPDPGNDLYGLQLNHCWPSVLMNDYGYQLLTQDDWYASRTFLFPSQFATDPNSRLVFGINQPNYKRSLGSATGSGREAMPVVIVDEGNSTRRATDQEINDNCELIRELEDMMRQSPGQGSIISPVTTESQPTPIFSQDTVADARSSASPARFVIETIPRATATSTST